MSIASKRCLIGGEWVEGSTHFPVVNPATGETIAHIPDLGATETIRAIDAAHAALSGWRAAPVTERTAFLHRWHDAILAQRESLAALIHAENGKPLAEAGAEVDYAASFLPVMAEEMAQLADEPLPSLREGQTLTVSHRAVGVCAAITPWNFPAAMVTRKAAPALAAGCTLILKPAEQTPLTALALARLAMEAGLPGGVLNVLTGDAATIGGVLAASPVVHKLSFTGSTEIGKLLYRLSADTVKKLTLELGGNAPALVFDDADLDVTVRALMIAKFRCGGQTCVAANRVLAQRGIAPALIAALAKAIAALKVGEDIGPLIDDAGVAKVERLVADAVAHGATVRVGGSRLEGRFYAPTLLEHVTPAMALWREELFGPVLALTVFENEDEALRLANDTPAGLAAYVFTRDPARATRVTERLECGMVGVNEGLISNAVAPFGGMKQSGLGREGGRWGLLEYLETQYVCARKTDGGA